ncbi:Aspartic proteinase [Komagataella phaffii CBS 7435]|uniref:Aspartic proteinase n=1 Tax=Komagataella phaffii (strain ATCC 76273 / CBS 7435 / CECT 11047 / NRRL Y-11430 / Wegner 21-1) TaxID=981350 RepID=F2QMN7_KOMPC|nr:Aspartic proteinase [Komagataella phaffii CBS 7435]CCA36842.1 Aspartic proteinase [Komagataella phaffii CBS 7435]
MRLSYLEIQGTSVSTLSQTANVTPLSGKLLNGLQEIGIVTDGKISKKFQENHLLKRNEALNFDVDLNKPICDQFGSFNPQSSRTFQSNDTAFSIRYLDNSFANGSWVRDTVYVGDFEIDQQSFALVDITNNYMGILGLGPSSQQTTNSDPTDNSFTYLGILDSLRAQGFINSASYSVYLAPDGKTDDTDHDDGEILFGAIDEAKINGQLKLFPYVNPYKSVYPDQYASYITVSSITVASYFSSRLVERIPQLALLDTGATFSYLPTYTLIRLAYAIHPGFEYVRQLGLFIIESNVLSSARQSTIDFRFGKDVVIRSNVSDHLLDVSQYFTSGHYLALTIHESVDGLLILGDTFIKSTYLFFDNDNSELGIGQIKITNDEDIQEVGEFTLERDSDYSSTWSIYSYETSLDPLSTGTGTGSTYSPTRSTTARSEPTTSRRSTTLQPRTTVIPSIDRLSLNSITSHGSSTNGTSPTNETSFAEDGGTLTPEEASLTTSLNSATISETTFVDVETSTTNGASVVSLSVGPCIIAFLLLIS